MLSRSPLSWRATAWSPATVLGRAIPARDICSIATRVSLAHRRGQVPVRLAQHGAKRVDVRKRRHGVTPHLLRAGVVGRHRGDGAIGGRDRAGSKQLADAEVDQLGDAIRIDEDVAGFQVAVNDEIAMRVIDRRTDVEKHPEPVVDGIRRSAASRQPRTIDVLHDEVGQAILGGAAVEQAADVRMLQAREGRRSRRKRARMNSMSMPGRPSLTATWA